MARTTSMRSRNPGTTSADEGWLNRALRSIRVPLTTKKIGTSMPKPMPSSLKPKIEEASVSSSSSSCFAAAIRTTTPAANAPSRTSIPKLVGDGGEGQHEQQRQPDGQLRAGPEALGDEGDDPLAPWPVRQEGGAEDEEGERGQHEDRLHRVRPREEEPDEHDRPELAHAAERHGIPTERRAQHSGVPQDRQQRSERRRGQGERDDDLAAVPTGHVDAKTDHGGQHDRQAPADARQLGAGAHGWCRASARSRPGTSAWTGRGPTARRRDRSAGPGRAPGGRG